MPDGAANSPLRSTPWTAPGTGIVLKPGCIGIDLANHHAGGAWPRSALGVVLFEFRQEAIDHGENDLSHADVVLSGNLLQPFMGFHW